MKTVLKVLVVEDQPFMREVAKAVIEKVGHQATIAVSGIDALNQLAAQRFDLVLMDVRLLKTQLLARRES